MSESTLKQTVEATEPTSQSVETVQTNEREETSQVQESLADRILRELAEKKKSKEKVIDESVVNQVIEPTVDEKFEPNKVVAGKEEIPEPQKETLADIMPEIDPITEVIVDEEHGVEIPEDMQVDELPLDEEVEHQAVTTNYATFSKEELVEALRQLLETQNIQQIKNEVETIKINFYKKHNAELAELRQKMLEETPEAEVKIEADPLEIEMKALYQKFKELRYSYNEELEKKKVENLKQKYQIIEDIKELLNKNEAINQTFSDFRDLQQRWKEIGSVPQADVKNLWDTYHHHVEKFYDYIKLNKELRDLDLKKNLEMKLTICEKAEELMLEPSIIKAFKSLQKLHNHWREIGPAPREKREEIWERFKDVTSKINKLYQEFFEELKNEQDKNLNAKTVLCEKAEELANLEITKNKDWEDKSKEMVELQKLWKTIGFAPKKDNNKIYIRFRNGCDLFFNKKRDFFTVIKDDQNNNLQLKTDLCMQAEAMKESTEWRKTTEFFIDLQKQWKAIGPVPRRHSDIIWKRFRTACNFFFDKKNEFFSSIDSVENENLKKKIELIEQAEAFQFSDDIDTDFNTLKEIQKQWTETGHVPFKMKDDIQKRFRDAINAKFDQLKFDESKRSDQRYKNRIETLSHSPRSNVKIKQEREKIQAKLEQVENDISLWENNIGFFAKTKNAEVLINDINDKIEKAKKLSISLREKLELMDGVNESSN